MIIPLPGETKETYYDGVKFLMDKGIQPETYTLMLLVGAEFGRDRAIKKHKMKSKYRILPKQFGSYNGKKSFEIEKVCIATESMNEQDYLECRNFGFVNRVLSNPLFNNVYKLAKKLNISWFDLSKKFSDFVKSEEYNGEFKQIYLNFCMESENELFDTIEEAEKFYSNEDNYKALLKGEVGENLIAKYTVQSLSSYNEIIEIIFKVFSKYFNSNLNNVPENVISSAISWLKDLYIINEILEVEKNSISEKNINLDFDFPNWIKSDHNEIGSYNTKKIYKISSNQELIKNIKEEMQINFGNDKNRAFGRYMERRGRGNIDFLEKNIALLTKKFLI